MYISDALDTISSSHKISLCYINCCWKLHKIMEDIVWSGKYYFMFHPYPQLVCFWEKKRGGQQIGVWWISVLIISSAVIIIVILLLFFREGLSDTWWIHSCWGAPRNKQKGLHIPSPPPFSLSLSFSFLFWRQPQTCRDGNIWHNTLFFELVFSVNESILSWRA